tara:strand:+ start:303 stop:530 length:228 start_codon:yes stop_codon:yes gene_type:complete
MLFSKENQSEFIRRIEEFVLSGDYGYIDAIILACAEYDIEPTIAAKYLSKPIIEKIEQEGIKFNMLPQKTSKLPI